MSASSALECGAFLLGVRASDIVGGHRRERQMLMIDHHPPRAAVARTVHWFDSPPAHDIGSGSQKVREAPPAFSTRLV